MASQMLSLYSKSMILLFIYIHKKVYPIIHKEERGITNNLYVIRKGTNMTTIKPCGLYSDRHRVNLYTFIIIH